MCIRDRLEGQFAAMTFRFGEHSIYITYRGTDNNMIGWKEDFNMSYLNSVPAQKRAVQYLSNQYSRRWRQIILGGHSKGGNLAVYAAACADSRVKSSSRGVHNFDGPGFKMCIRDRRDITRLAQERTGVSCRSAQSGSAYRPRSFRCQRVT